MRFLTVSGMLLLASAGICSAQSIKGTVRDTTGPLRQVAVSFSDVRSHKPMRTTTDSTGAFEFRHVPASTFTLTVQRPPNQWTTLSYTIGPKERLNIAVSVSPANNLAVAKIETDRTGYLEKAGFYDRLQTVHGSFFTRADITESNKQDLTQLLSNVRGVRVVGTNGGRDIVFRSAVSTGMSPDDGSTAPRVALDEGTPCYPSVYIDGTIMRPASLQEPTTALDDVEAIDNIEAIELYQVTEVPPQFTRFNETCGVVVLWRRRGM